MENFKFILISIIIILGMGLLGYWAVRTLEPGDVHLNKQKQEELEERNRILEDEVEKLKSDLATLLSEKEIEQKTEEQKTEVIPQSTTTYKYQTLIKELEKLIADKIIMKLGSQGTRVGTLQNFLNIYNKTSKKIDNDFGAGTKTDLINFQKAEKLTADGEAGAGTFAKMIEWLKKQK